MTHTQPVGRQTETKHTHTHTDWTVSNESLVTFDANAQVYEDNIRFRMGPFGAYLHASAGEQELFTESGYKWCVASRRMTGAPHHTHPGIASTLARKPEEYAGKQPLGLADRLGLLLPRRARKAGRQDEQAGR